MPVVEALDRVHLVELGVDVLDELGVAAQAVHVLGDHEGGVAGQAQGEGVDALDLLDALEEGGGVPAGVVGLDDLGGELRVGAVAQGAIDEDAREPVHEDAHVGHAADDVGPHALTDLEVTLDPLVLEGVGGVDLHAHPHPVLGRVGGGGLDDLGRGVDDNADALGAEPGGVADVPPEGVDHLVVVEKAAGVALGVQEHVVDGRRGAVLRHEVLPLGVEGVGQVGLAGEGEAGDHLLAEGLDAERADLGGRGDRVLKGEGAVGVLVLVRVEADTALDPGHGRAPL